MGLTVSHCVEEHICGNEINHKFVTRQNVLSPPFHQSSTLRYKLKEEREKIELDVKSNVEEKENRGLKQCEEGKHKSSEPKQEINSTNFPETIAEENNDDTSFLSTVFTKERILSKVEVQSERNESPTELNLATLEIELLSEDSSKHYPSISSNESVLTTISPTKDIPIRNSSLSR
jgi:hypothetical protein